MSAITGWDSVARPYSTASAPSTPAFLLARTVPRNRLLGENREAQFGLGTLFRAELIPAADTGVVPEIDLLLEDRFHLATHAPVQGAPRVVVDVQRGVHGTLVHKRVAIIVAGLSVDEAGSARQIEDALVGLP